MPHFCYNHPDGIAHYGPVRGKFYCGDCREIAYSEQARVSSKENTSHDMRSMGYRTERRIRRRDGAIVGAM